MRSLRIRLTCIVTIILFINLILLNLFSIYSGTKHFVKKQVMEMKPIQNVEITPNTKEDLSMKHMIDKEIDNKLINNLSVDIKVQEAQRNFKIEQWIVFFVISIGGLGLTYYSVGKTLKPLEYLTNKAKEIDVYQLHTSLPVPVIKDEVYELTTSFNGMLTRLNHAFEVQKHFAQSAAHELKTPLTMMKSSLQILEIDEACTIEEYKETIEVMNHSTQRLIDIVEKLLLLNNQETVKVEKVDIKQIINECIEAQNELIEEMSITIVQNIQQSFLYTHPILIRCVISNVITNAIKYNREGGKIEIEISPTHNKTKIIFKDTGIGIKQKDLPHIIDIFYRTHERDSMVQGYGLGLALVKQIIEKLNGELEIKSIYGEGTEVSITI